MQRIQWFYNRASSTSSDVVCEVMRRGTREAQYGNPSAEGAGVPFVVRSLKNIFRFMLPVRTLRSG